jgi:hypothetical protein
MKNKIVFLVLVSQILLKADEFSFVWYNDFFAGTDKHFTNGAALSWLDDNKEKDSYTKLLLEAARKISLSPDLSYNYNAGITIKQIMVTPQNTELSTPQYDDLPYAGYLALSTYLIQRDNDSFIEYALDLGVIGKQALAGNLQNLFHQMIGNDKSQGWDTQLKTEYILNVFLQYGTISYEKNLGDGYGVDWFNHIGVDLGNFNTAAIAGTAFRIGKNYTRNFNVHYPFLHEEASLVKLNKVSPNFGWAISTGVDIKGLAYSYILDEAENEGYNTKKNNFDYSFNMCGELYLGNHKVSLLYQSQSPYARESKEIDLFGAFMYAYQF